VSVRFAATNQKESGDKSPHSKIRAGQRQIGVRRPGDGACRRKTSKDQAVVGPFELAPLPGDGQPALLAGP